MIRAGVLGLAASLLALGPAAAQDLDCANAMAQQDMNACAHSEWQARDAELNAAYKAARAAYAGYDNGTQASDRGAVETLKAAQKAWIVFRDAACTAEAVPMQGGSAEPLLYYGCMARLTAARTADLWSLADGGG